MSAAPRMLAGFVQSSLQAIDDIDAGLGREVRKRLEGDTLTVIESAAAISLIPVALDVELTECFFEVAGEGRARRALRENLRQSCDKPLLKPVLDGARILFGRSLVKAIAWAPKVWGLIYRDAGEMLVAAREDRCVRLELRDIPLVIAASPNYLVGSAESFAGFFDIAGVTAAVTLIGPDLARRSSSFEFRWAD